MIHLNPFAIANLIIAITYFPLFILIAIKGKTRIARVYSLHILAICLWGIGAFLGGINQNQAISINLWKFAYSAVIFIPIFFLHSVLILTKRNSRFLITLIYIQAIYFLWEAQSGGMFSSVRLVFNSFYYVNGKIIYLYSFISWVVTVSFAHLLLIQYYKTSYPGQKEQIASLILAIIGFLGGAMNFLPGFNINIYPHGNLLVPIHSIIVTYAILKHQLLDIIVVIKKSLIYSILITSITVTYLILVILSERLLQGTIGYQSLLVSVGIAFLIGLVFSPLRNKIQYFVDKYFFKGTQAQIAEENERLRQEVAQAEKLKTVATLASGMAHEIKNPLTAIKTFVEYLPERKDNPEFLDKFTRIVGAEVDRIDGLVHQLLEFAKPSPLALKETNIHQLIDETLSLLNNQLVQHKIDLIRDYNADRDQTLNIDPNQIRQALLNIFLNAIEAMKYGGTLRVQTEDYRLKTKDQSSQKSLVSGLQSGVHKGFLKITISDTGSGIHPKDLPHVFDPFFSKKDHGTGLGLAITHGIIQEHGGKIKVESELGKGTEAILELPIIGSEENKG
ncbi:MAG TPA: ATP-binding protein [Candidatus Omnitrophota bacterium]|nr:ATP-binding protein [Candidatus Omnitrophota bacterium]HPD85632.1 ATP-binding protein [Candidatus Omnitrophota bacterium]HRZ04475.1 ATP-binding protein [Candidatus Omnitrophota bacterium]